jgi:SnoaL-like polyketide cyclase
VKPNLDHVAGVSKAFPDTKLTELASLAADSFAVGEFASEGTQTGPLPGLKPMNKHVSTRFLAVVEIQGGKVVREISYENSADARVQLGLMPPLVPAPAGSAPAGPSGAPVPSSAPLPSAAPRP